MAKSRLSNILSIVYLLYGSVSASGAGPYDYHSNGADWSQKFPDCGLTNQSPIDLKTQGLRIVAS